MRLSQNRDTSFILYRKKQLHAAFNIAQKTHGNIKDRVEIGLAWEKILLKDIYLLYQGGLTRGYTSAIVLCPQKNVGVIVLCNNGNEPRNITNLALKLTIVLDSN